MADPTTMIWPTWGHRLTPVSIWRFSAYNGFYIRLRDWYFGPWLRVSFGWWCLQLGSGVYEELGVARDSQEFVDWFKASQR